MSDFRLWDDERELDAALALEDDGHPMVVVQSAGGGNKRRGIPKRNPDYPRAVELLFCRLRDAGVQVIDAAVSSADASALPFAHRRIVIARHPFPWSFTGVDVHELRLEIGRAVAAIGRSDEARESSGNRQKLLRLWLSKRVSIADLARPPSRKT